MEPQTCKWPPAPFLVREIGRCGKLVQPSKVDSSLSNLCSLAVTSQIAVLRRYCTLLRLR